MLENWFFWLGVIWKISMDSLDLKQGFLHEKNFCDFIASCQSKRKFFALGNFKLKCPNAFVKGSSTTYMLITDPNGICLFDFYHYDADFF